MRPRRAAPANLSHTYAHTHTPLHIHSLTLIPYKYKQDHIRDHFYRNSLQPNFIGIPAFSKKKKKKKPYRRQERVAHTHNIRVWEGWGWVLGQTRDGGWKGEENHGGTFGVCVELLVE